MDIRFRNPRVLRTFRMRRYLILFLVTFLCFAVTLQLFFTVRELSLRHVKNEFIARAHDRAELIKSSITDNLAALFTVADFYTASHYVTRVDFGKFTSEILNRHPDILSLAWLPRITEKERAAFEDSLHKEGFPGFKITEFNDQEKLVKAGKRQEYFPIYYIEPFKKNQVMLGYDVASDNLRWQAMQKSRDSATAVEKEKISFTQKMSANSGYRAFLPVYRQGVPHDTLTQRQQNLLGFVSFLFDVGKMVGISLQDLQPTGIEIYIFDETEKQPKLIYFSGKGPVEVTEAELRKDNDYFWKKTFISAGSVWSIVCLPTQAFLKSYKDWQSPVILVTGIIACFFIFIYLLSLLWRAERIELLVRERTVELNTANEELLKFSNAIRQSPTMVMITDLQGNIEYVNPKFTKVTGYTQEEAVGKNPRFLACEKMPQEETDKLWETIKSGKEWRGEFKNEKKDGQVYWEFASISPIKNHEGKVIHYLAMKEDITERKLIEEALHFSEEKYRELVENANSIILKMDRNGNVTFLNEFGQKFFGFGAVEINGRSVIGTIVPPTDHSGADLAEMIQGIGIHPEKYINNENENMRKNAERVWISWTNKAIYGPDNEIAGILCIGNDVTERKKAQDKIKEAAEIKSKFTSMVSHELRTPLTAIKEGISLVVDGSTGPLNSEQKDFLGIVKRNVDRLGRLINEVLDFQKLEAGKLEFIMQLNQVNEVAREVFRTMEPLAKNKGLELVIETDENLPKIEFDKDRITQVLTNIVNNSFKFTEKGGIKISTARQNENILVCVKDTGMGIKEEDFSKLFHSFEQLAKEKERKPGGTGLGLAISKAIIERHEGKIWAESEFGKGTTFCFTLPIKN
ncbi:MAG: PAS domain S-box protein [Candidatus Omnitrophica bacterium]|nr:PAS domain S-box protein [Candidatus Omnitrophota bacterium]MDD5653479.1 PAS domain S-box protein [Candidatus Omnitrophota bacterium]